MIASSPLDMQTLFNPRSFSWISELLEKLRELLTLPEAPQPVPIPVPSRPRRRPSR
jgi:hypothetical protein